MGTRCSRRPESGYLLETKPKAYQVFDYLNELRQKYPTQVYEGSVGGWFSHICAPTYLNFDESLIKTKDERLAFDIITVRLGELFEALYLLRNDLLKRRSGLCKLTLNDFTVREVLFGCLKRSYEHTETGEIFNDFLPGLHKVYLEMFEAIWLECKPNPDNSYLYELANGFGFDLIGKKS